MPRWPRILSRKASSMSNTVWGIHCKDEKLMLQGNVMTIGWEDFGNLSSLTATRDAFKAHYAETHPDASKGQVATCAGVLYRFAHEVNVGDYVVFPSKSDRNINIGIIEGEYEYAGDGVLYPNRRKVKWLKHIPRLSFSQGALYELGCVLSLFQVKNYADEFLGAIEKGFSAKHLMDDDVDETVGTTADEIVESTRDFILKELSRNLKGYALEEFVANLLDAMGYRTTVSPQGGDSGIDITAYKDELPPRILVQVKSGGGDIKESTIQSLKGAMREGDYGLFVTLSNYTKNAQKYLENTPIIRGVSGGELVELILKYYELLDDKYRRMIPLKKVYIPVPKDE